MKDDTKTPTTDGSSTLIDESSQAIEVVTPAIKAEKHLGNVMLFFPNNEGCLLLSTIQMVRESKTYPKLPHGQFQQDWDNPTGVETLIYHRVHTSVFKTDVPLADVLTAIREHRTFTNADVVATKSDGKAA